MKIPQKFFRQHNAIFKKKNATGFYRETKNKSEQIAMELFT